MEAAGETVHLLALKDSILAMNLNADNAKVKCKDSRTAFLGNAWVTIMSANGRLLSNAKAVFRAACRAKMRECWNARGQCE